ncbi:uncharacterized protein LOC142665030, partial [Rhinoderma darwinii]|uniref:uncharacterized protein LOC142665030 n=1 Tax=Rhinoderma darwinii TaxID=43563 RepID=UPI003F66C36E
STRPILLTPDICCWVELGHPPNTLIDESHLCEDFLKLNGTLGKSLTLYRLHVLKEYETLSLKYITNKTKKKLLVHNLGSNKSQHLPNISHNKYQFKDSSVLIHHLQKDDEKDYELLAETKNGDEDFCNIKVKVYEQISHLTVNVTEDSQNNTCKITMKCLVQTGENVTFSWMMDEKNLSDNSSTLEVRITSDNAKSTYRCTAKNPVSERSGDHTLSSACNPDKDNHQDDNHLLIYILVITPIVLVIIVVVIVVILKRCNRGMCSKQYNDPASISQSRPPAPTPVLEQTHEDPLSVYAKVQKPENPRISSLESKNPPVSSVYELAGSCRYDADVRNVANAETTVLKPDPISRSPLYLLQSSCCRPFLEL